MHGGTIVETLVHRCLMLPIWEKRGLMKIQTALEVAKDCGLETVGEAIFNIKLHAVNLFSYSDIQKELAELENTWEWTKSHRKTHDGKTINEDTPVNLILENHIAEDLSDYETNI